jgi:hypothetical protein
VNLNWRIAAERPNLGQIDVQFAAHIGFKDQLSVRKLFNLAGQTVAVGEKHYVTESRTATLP